MKINWKVRLKNPVFWITMVPAVLTLIYTALDLLGVAPRIAQDSVMDALRALVTLLAMLGIVNDPTTKGTADSTLALTYDAPREDGDRGAATVTLDEFTRQYMGTAMDYDGSAGAQCVDLIKLYLDKVFGIGQFSFGGSARMLYENYQSMPKEFRAAFVRIANTPDFVPHKGDICVWGSSVGGGHGHVAIATGEGTTKRFYSWDMNWNGKAMKRVEHTYSGFLGVLRPLDQVPVKGVIYSNFQRYIGTSGSFVDALNAIGQPSNYAYRRQIAHANGISPYTGTAKQNTTLLQKLKAGTLAKP